MDEPHALEQAAGYEQLDVLGGSYGATAAQVYLKLHPSSVRTLILLGASAIDVPFARYALNAQRASTSSRGSAPPNPPAERRSRAGSASSARS